MAEILKAVGVKTIKTWTENTEGVFISVETVRELVLSFDGSEVSLNEEAARDLKKALNTIFPSS